MSMGLMVATALVSGTVGGLAALCVRLITPGETFLRPPSGLSGPWSRIMVFLTYTSDLILGAIAGMVVLGVGGIDASNPARLIATCIVAGLGGSGFIANLGTKLQAESDTEASREDLRRNEELWNRIQGVAGQVQGRIEADVKGAVPDPTANQLSTDVAQIQTIAEARLTPPAITGRLQGSNGTQDARTWHPEAG